MKTTITNKLLALFLTAIMVVGLFPTAVFAWEEVATCEFCGKTIGDDWICSCGEHCSDEADGGCYLDHHCQMCSDGFPSDEFCEDHHMCLNCAMENEAHCSDCGNCFEDYEPCHGGCARCGECCGDWCSECDMCVECAKEHGFHCDECDGCLTSVGICEPALDEFGVETPLCLECCIDLDFHCEECGAHVGENDDLWCPDCGPGEHCVQCVANHGGVCSVCDKVVCFSQGEDNFCMDCYACSECVEEHLLHCSGCGDCGSTNAICLGSIDAGYNLCEDCCKSGGFHCSECGEHVEDDDWCPVCGEGHCINCFMNDGDYCASCDKFYCFIGGDVDDLCEECGTCVECGVLGGTHCLNCEECLNGVAERCEGSEDNLCIDCCESEGNHCELCGEHVEEWCEECGEGSHCLNCRDEEAIECAGCGELFCYYYYDGDVLCEYCEMCENCAVHCPECDCCAEEVGGWCEAGGEGSHCLECCEDNGWICEGCGRCTEGEGLDRCDYCGMCEDCCREASMEAGCSTGDICIDDMSFDDHFCPECEEVCDCENEFCEYCGMCEACEQALRVSLGCTHEAACPKSLEWSEHYCTDCGHCFESCDCGSTGTCAECKKNDHSHVHSYNEDGLCEECMTRKDGAPVIVKDPKDASCIVNAPGKSDNKVEFAVKANGENLTYQWYLDGVAVKSSKYGSGFTSAKATFIVPEDACHTVHEVYCVVTNENGEATSETATINASHSHKWIYDNEQYHSLRCVGKDCTEVQRANVEHNYGSYVTDEHGNKARICSACGHKKPAPLTGTAVKVFTFVVDIPEPNKAPKVPTILSSGAYISSYRWYEQSTGNAPEGGILEGGKTYYLEITAQTVDNRPVAQKIDVTLNGKRMELVETSSSGSAVTYRYSFKLSNVPLEEPPVIIKHPMNYWGTVPDEYYTAWGEATATFTVRAVGGKNLTYQWVLFKNGTDFTPVEGVDGTGFDTDTAVFYVPYDACNVYYEVGCIVSNEYGSTESNLAEMNAKHRMENVCISATEHVLRCVGDCSYVKSTTKHRFPQGWVMDAYGNEKRTCPTCGYTQDNVNHDNCLYSIYFEVAEPIVGAAPARPVITSEHAYVYEYNWSGSFANGTFKEGETYTLNITAKAMDNYTLASGPIVTYPSGYVNGRDAEMTTHTGSEICSYRIQFTVDGTTTNKPIITKQPVDLHCLVCDYDGESENTAVFSVEATGGALTYQWHLRFFGGAEWTLNSNYGSGFNTSEATFNIPEDACCMTYEVWCDVTNANGTTSSSIATITADHNCKWVYENDVYHMNECLGDGCHYSEASHRKHRYPETWDVTKYGESSKTCRDCGHVIHKELTGDPISNFEFTVEEPEVGAAPSKPRVTTAGAFIKSYDWLRVSGGWGVPFDGGFAANESYILAIHVAACNDTPIGAQEDLTATVNGSSMGYRGGSEGVSATFYRYYNTTSTAPNHPVITKQPSDVTAAPNPPDTDVFSEDNRVEFSVTASGTNVHYQWYYGFFGTNARYAIYDDFLNAVGYDDATLSFMVPGDACDSKYEIWCEVYNENGTAISGRASLDVDHYFVCQPHGSDKHITDCYGEGCTATLGEAEPHNYKDWKTDKYGNKTRTCKKCGYVQSYNLDWTNGIDGFEFDVIAPVAGAKPAAPILITDGAYIVNYLWTDDWSFGANEVEGNFEKNSRYRLHVSVKTKDNRAITNKIGTVNGEIAEIISSNSTSISYTYDFTTLDPLSYVAAAKQSGKTFPTVKEGYSEIPEQTLSFSNAGTGKLDNISITLGGANASCFTLNTEATANTLDPKGTTTYKVKPNLGLVAGTYTATVNITADNMAPISTQIRFTVGVADPVIIPGGCLIKGVETVEITTLTAGATIYYTTNGSIPTTNSKRYEGPFNVFSPMTIKAIAIMEGRLDSDVVSVVFTKEYISGALPGTPSYTLAFNSNGGSNIASVAAVEGMNIILDFYKPTRDGYDFAGWYSDAELTNAVTSVKMTGNITVYAGWTAKEDPPIGEWTNPFIDVIKTDWFYGDVVYVAQNGYMSGTSSNLFSPNAPATRGMIVEILWELEGSPAASGNCPFSDVKAGSYYLEAITWAAENGIVNGYGDGKFGPEDTITREQMAALLYRYSEFKGYDVSAKDDLSAFTDVGKISAYALANVQWAVEEGLVIGNTDKTLDPAAKATRAQFAAILHRFVERFVK